MAFDYDGFYATLALSSVKKAMYIDTMEQLHPELSGWSERFQNSVQKHPPVYALIQEAKEISGQKKRVKSLLSDIRQHYSQKPQDVNCQNKVAEQGIKHKIGLAAIIFAMNKRDVTASLKHYGVKDHTMGSPENVHTSSVNDQSLLSEQNQAVYQTVYYNYF